MFDYIRQKSTGQLHKVHYYTVTAYHTSRVSDGVRAVVSRDDADRIYKLAAYPGDDEILLKSNEKREASQ